MTKRNKKTKHKIWRTTVKIDQMREADWESKGPYRRAKREAYVYAIKIFGDKWFRTF